MKYLQQTYQNQKTNLPTNILGRPINLKILYLLISIRIHHPCYFNLPQTRMQSIRIRLYVWILFIIFIRYLHSCSSQMVKFSHRFRSELKCEGRPRDHYTLYTFIINQRWTLRQRTLLAQRTFATSQPKQRGSTDDKNRKTPLSKHT